MQAFWSIRYGFLFSPVMHFTGHLTAHSPQPMHLSVIMTYSTRSRHLPVKHFLSSMCITYSSSKYCSAEITGFGVVCPSAQSEAFCMASDIDLIFSISSFSPLPFVIFSSSCSICFPPILQGEHLPHASSTENWR